MFKKIIICSLCALLVSFSLMAQSLSVTYARKVDPSDPTLFQEAGLPEDIRSMLANAYSQLSISYILNYSNKESSFSVDPSNSDQKLSILGQSVDINTIPQQVVYKNHKSHTSITQTPFMGKVFLIKDGLLMKEFKIIDDDKKTILGFECIHAQYVDEPDMEVWFTPDIEIQDGPNNYGLPGLVLESKEKGISYIAIAINMDKIVTITPPQKGEKVSAEEYQKLANKRIKMLKR